jgi:hypothetical protein
VASYLRHALTIKELIWLHKCNPSTKVRLENTGGRDLRGAGDFVSAYRLSQYPCADFTILNS